MKELTIKEKASLVDLLKRHYTIKEKSFINAIASNEEEKLNLTLKACAIGAEQINTSTNVPTNASFVVINKLYSKIRFVKAIKDEKNMGLSEAKDLADQLIIACEEVFGEFHSKPFPIGDSSNSIFTDDQWVKICAFLGDDMVWEYV